MISCQYRFFPKNRAQEICLSEVSFLTSSRASDAPAVWSLYGEDATSGDELVGDQQTRELLRGLTHEIGNHLQTISGEVDLLRLGGVLSSEKTNMIDHGLKQIRKVAREIDASLCPPALDVKTEDPALILREVVLSSEKQLADHGIRTSLLLRESLPKVRLDWQFSRALKEIIDFSHALLPQGGQLKIEAGVRRVRENRYIELTVINASPVSLGLEEKDVFRPFLKVNNYRAGLSLAVARQILRRHFGKIAFRKERTNQGIFSILIKVPSEGQKVK